MKGRHMASEIAKRILKRMAENGFKIGDTISAEIDHEKVLAIRRFIIKVDEAGKKAAKSKLIFGERFREAA